MLRRMIVALLALFFFATSSAGESAHVDALLVDTDVTTAGGASVVMVQHPGHSRGYLVVTTSAEVATASLAITMHTAGVAAAMCTMPAITTATTTVGLIGSEVTAATPVDYACDFPMARTTTFLFTVTGAGAGFTIDASMYWLPE